MDWMHGYYAHVGYSYGYYPETMPVRLRWAALRHKHLIPERNFRYLDAGCGQGYNLIIAAAMHPDSEFVGIDFMPDHVAHARSLAKRCGLTNVTVIEGDFIELAADPSALGEFDMAICHGISSWVAPAVKNALYSLIGRVLRPGGIFYNSYNTYPGWLAVWPFQHLVQLEQLTKPGMEAINAARATMDKLGEASDLLFKALPNLQGRLKTLDKQEPAYLQQEYNDQHWKPLYVSEMIEAMGAVKLEFLGTATLGDAFDNALKPKARALVQAQPSTILREQMRDYAILQSFRRDLYVKGRPNLWDLEANEAVRTLGVRLNPLTARPAEGEPYRIQASTVELLGAADVYSTLLDRLADMGGVASIGELVDAEPDKRRKAGSFETLSMLLQGGWITPNLEHASTTGHQISLAIATAASQGAPYRCLPLPGTGVAARLVESDLILIKLLAEGVSADKIGGQLIAALGRLGRQLGKDGKPVTDEADRAAMLAGLVSEFHQTKRPYLEAVGAL